MTALQVLTVKQTAALEALSASQFQTAARLKVAGSTLTSLASRGLVEIRWPSSTRKVGMEPATYRITGKGVLALRRARAIDQSR